jgi:hypothetical protein
MRHLSRPSLDWVLVFVPVSIVPELLGQPTVVVITSALAIVPLAGLIGGSPSRWPQSSSRSRTASTSRSRSRSSR